MCWWITDIYFNSYISLHKNTAFIAWMLSGNLTVIFNLRKTFSEGFWRVLCLCLPLNTVLENHLYLPISGWKLCNENSYASKGTAEVCVSEHLAIKLYRNEEEQDVWGNVNSLQEIVLKEALITLGLLYGRITDGNSPGMMMKAIWIANTLMHLYIAPYDLNIYM